MEPSLGKSGVNHRMRKLEEIALKIQKEKSFNKRIFFWA